MKKIFDSEVLDHGVKHSQYFQGCGVSLTPFTDVATGIGMSAHEAYEDALDSLAQNDWDLKGIKRNSMSKKITVPEDSEDCYHYISIRVREKENKFDTKD